MLLLRSCAACDSYMHATGQRLGTSSAGTEPPCRPAAYIRGLSQFAGPHNLKSRGLPLQKTENNCSPRRHMELLGCCTSTPAASHDSKRNNQSLSSNVVFFPWNSCTFPAFAALAEEAPPPRPPRNPPRPPPATIRNNKSATYRLLLYHAVATNSSAAPV